MPPGLFPVQAAQPLAAKLLSGAQNVSFQANATADAAAQAVLDAQHKLSALKHQLQTAKAARKAAASVFKAAPAAWGKAQFKVSADLKHSSSSDSSSSDSSRPATIVALDCCMPYDPQDRL
jgi:hypothetical protein